MPARPGLVAVKGNGALLEQVPDRLKTGEMCLEAVRQHPETLPFVPKRFLTDGLVAAAAVRTGLDAGVLLRLLQKYEACRNWGEDGRSFEEMISSEKKV